MNITITFAELSGLIKKNYDKSIELSRVSSKEICVAYDQRIIFRTVKVPVNVTIDKVDTDAVTVIYNGGFGIDMIIAGVLSFMKAKVPELNDILVAGEGHRLRIELSNLQQTAKLIEAVRLEDIEITENGISLSAALK